MAAFIARRLLVTIPLLFAVTIVVFLLGRVTPGDPIAQLLGGQDINDPALLKQLRAEYGLDQPLPVQYVSWVGHAVRGDLGKSIRSGRPVAEMVWQGLQKTGMIATGAVILVMLLGWSLGVLSAVINVRGGSALLDRVFGLAPIVVTAIPSFSLAVVLIFLFAIRLGWLPTSGVSDVRTTELNLVDLAKHMVLPVITLAWSSLGSNWRLARNSVIEVLREDYIRTAHAKGLGNLRIYGLHAFRNSMIPLVTSAGLLFGGLLSGSFILEYLFAWPGIGLFVVESVLYRDYPAVQGATLVLAAIYLVINLLVDVTYAIIDPRIRYG